MKKIDCIYCIFILLSATYSLCVSLVSSARVDRMKEAKSEAEQIISAYRAEMEAQYQKSLATVSSMFL